MNTGLLSQLDAYYSQIDEMQDPIRPEEVAELLETVRVLPLARSVSAGQLPARRVWVAAAAAVVVLVLVGGVAWLSSQRAGDVVDQPTATTVVDQPTTITGFPPPVGLAEVSPPVLDTASESVTTPWSVADLPPEAETGTLSTPLGTASWVHLPLGENSLWSTQCFTFEDGGGGCRSGGVALPWPSGFALFQHSLFSPYPFGLPARLLVSSNGVEWREEPLPSDPAAAGVSLTHDGDVYWLFSWNPAGLWRSTDGATWHEIDPSGLAPPLPFGPDWQVSVTPPVTAGDLTLTYISTQRDDSPRDDDQHLYIIKDSGITPIDVPWTDSHHAEALFGAEDWVYAYVRLRDQPAVTVWGTTDGRSWTDLGPPLFTDGEPTGTLWFSNFFGPLTASDFGEPQSDAWETTDGTTWSRAPTGRPDSTYPVLRGSGWFANGGSIGGPDDGSEWWMHIDDTWISLSELGMQGDSQRCVVSGTGTGNTTFFLNVTNESEECGTQMPAGDMWILHIG